MLVPACCTDRLQPLDLSVSRIYKEEIKACSHEWYVAYANQVSSTLEDMEDDVEEDV